VSTIGCLTLLKKSDSPLSPHFGKAKWLMVLNRESQQIHFVQNTGLNGRSVVELLQQQGCDEVVFSNIGEGALRQLKQSRIAGWYAPADLPVPRVLEMLSAGQLRLARKPGPGRRPSRSPKVFCIMC
jgi:predicted Fe-Mo cluster-binding NifX family protein